jgi:hypothetical protein
MPVTINGTTGVVTPGATIGSINGILKSSSGVVSQAVAGTDYGQLTLGTSQTASGTSVDFTGIPSWVKRVTVMLNGVSTNGTSSCVIQIGSGSFSSSGYSSAAANDSTASISTVGFILEDGAGGISSERYGSIQISNISGNSWVSTAIIYGKNSSNPVNMIAGGVTISGILDRVRVTTVNGTDTFDSGTINISYE